MKTGTDYCRSRCGTGLCAPPRSVRRLCTLAKDWLLGFVRCSNADTAPILERRRVSPVVIVKPFSRCPHGGVASAHDLMMQEAQSMGVRPWLESLMSFLFPSL